ncbi:MAG: alpha/beta hydrolase [Sphingomonadaceae bacterium]|nr:alpha/beta hydrolase [Sphingomonadaceae bacterium]
MPVYRNFSQAELDAEYNNRARFPNFDDHFAAWERWSEATRARHSSAIIDDAFGPDPNERIDIFPAAGDGCPIYVFIHGGYWYSLDKRNYSYTADGMNPHGIATVVNNFGLAPEYDMDQIVEHNRAALAHIWRTAHQWGGDCNRIYVGGHSAGGHLAAMLLMTDWPRYQAGLPAGLVRGACAIGGIFDLEPIRLSFLNQKLYLTEQQVAVHSPLQQKIEIDAPMLLIIAEDESPEFHRQTDEMHEFWSRHGLVSEKQVPSGLDHFDVVNKLGDPNCPLVAAQLRHMALAFRANTP